jgi:hypothetical protein
MPSTNFKELEAITTVRRHMHWTSDQKLEIINQIHELGIYVFLIVFNHGLIVL